MTQKNYLEEWLNFQKQVVDFFQDSMSFKPEDEGEEKAADIIELSLKPVQEYMQKWLDVSNELYKQTFKSLGAYELYEQTFKSFEDNYSQQEIIKKIFNGANLYQNLNKFWIDLSASITDKDSDPFQFYSRWNHEYIKNINQNVIAFLPKQMQAVFKETIDVCDMSAAAAGKFFKPWLEEAVKLQNLLKKSMGGDHDAYIEFSRMWRDNFSSSYGKILSMPQFSMNREQMHKQMQAVNSLIKFINSMNEYMATLVKVNQETLSQIVKDYQQMLTSGTHPKTFKEFYKFWIKQNESAYLKLFGTSEFSALLSQVLDAGVNFKKEFDNLLEKELEFLPYPTKTDMDSVYKTLDTLKRDIRALKKDVAALREDKSRAKRLAKED